MDMVPVSLGWPPPGIWRFENSREGFGVVR